MPSQDLNLGYRTQSSAHWPLDYSRLTKGHNVMPSQDLNLGYRTQSSAHWPLDYSRLTKKALKCFRSLLHLPDCLKIAYAQSCTPSSQSCWIYDICSNQTEHRFFFLPFYKALSFFYTTELNPRLSMVHLKFSSLSALGYTRWQQIKTYQTMQPKYNQCQYP